MDRFTLLADVQAQLQANGFSGLYAPTDHCGCSIGDLAPCGECSRENGEQYMNRCKPGYKHLDPRPSHVEYGDYVITDQKESPEDDEFDNFYD